MSLMLGQFQAPSRGKGPGAGVRERRGQGGALGGGWGSARLGGAVGNGEEALLGGGHVRFRRSDLSSVKRGGGEPLSSPHPQHTRRLHWQELPADWPSAVPRDGRGGREWQRLSPAEPPAPSEASREGASEPKVSSQE